MRGCGAQFVPLFRIVGEALGFCQLPVCGDREHKAAVVVEHPPMHGAPSNADMLGLISLGGPPSPDDPEILADHPTVWRRLTDHAHQSEIGGALGARNVNRRTSCSE